MAIAAAHFKVKTVLSKTAEPLVMIHQNFSKKKLFWILKLSLLETKET
jgi:hypothetical protein